MKSLPVSRWASFTGCPFFPLSRPFAFESSPSRRIRSVGSVKNRRHTRRPSKRLRLWRRLPLGLRFSRTETCLGDFHRWPLCRRRGHQEKPSRNRRETSPAGTGTETGRRGTEERRKAEEQKRKAELVAELIGNWERPLNFVNSSKRSKKRSPNPISPSLNELIFRRLPAESENTRTPRILSLIFLRPSRSCSA